MPARNLLGRAGGGFGHLMENLPTERISIAFEVFVSARAALDWTVTYTSE